METQVVLAGEFISLDDVYETVAFSEEEKRDFEILYAFLWNGQYEGSVFILARHIPTGEFYDHGDSHCSCNDFGPFTPSRVTVETALIEVKNESGIDDADAVAKLIG